MEKFALHSIKSGRALSDLALRKVDIDMLTNMLVERAPKPS